jgi:cytochrome c
MSRHRIERLLGVTLLAVLLIGPFRSVTAALLGHGGPVRGIAVSADGRTAVTAGFDYSVIVWRLVDETVRARLQGHDGPVNAVAISADGRTVVSASDDGTVAVWDLSAGTQIRRLRAEAKLGSVALSPDGLEVAAGGWDGSIHRWRLPEGAAEAALLNGGERVTALAFSVDGNLLLAGGHEGSLRAWRSVGGTPAWHVPAHDFGLTALAPLPDGTIVTGSIDRSLRRWNLVDGRRLGDLVGPEQPIVAASRDGSLLASAGAKGEAMAWRAAEDHPYLVLAGSGPTIWALAFTSDGARLLGGGADGAVRVWDLATGGALGQPIPDTTPAAPGRGPELFARCAACHTLSADAGHKAGPTLAGLFGRRAGSLAGYGYSPALQSSGIVWTEETISRLFDLGPDQMVPGSKMPLQRLSNPRDRADLVAYLKRMAGG